MPISSSHSLQRFKVYQEKEKCLRKLLKFENYVFALLKMYLISFLFIDLKA